MRVSLSHKVINKYWLLVKYVVKLECYKETITGHFVDRVFIEAICFRKKQMRNKALHIEAKKLITGNRRLNAYAKYVERNLKFYPGQQKEVEESIVVKNALGKREKANLFWEKQRH